MDNEAWKGFKGDKWKTRIDVRNFIQENYTPYDGDETFLADATEATDRLWGELQKLQKAERAKGGVLDMDTDVVSDIDSHPAGYLDKDLEKMIRPHLPRKVPCVFISSSTGEGLQELKDTLWKALQA